MTNNSMTVITSKPFGSLSVDVYEDSKHEYYMTREQIGQALECKEPRKYIAKIHERNADRLDKLSTVVNLTTVEGGITKHRDIMVYNLKGVMEICRFSRQPKADKFMDFCWDVMESLMRGDAILATPKMDSALTPEFMQAQLAMFLNGQKDADRKLRALHDELNNAREEIENLRGLTNETLSTVSSVGIAVRQIKEKQMDDSIRAKSYTPSKDSISDWRKDMYSRIKTIAKLNDMQTADVMSKIYLCMRDVYGFVANEEKKNYKQRTGRTYNVSTIDVVEDSKTYKSIFESLVKDLHAEALNNKNENFFDPPKAIEAAPEVDANIVPVIEVEAKEVEHEPVEPVVEAKPKKQSDAAKYLTPVIEPLAVKHGDRTLHYHKTYRMVYDEIGFAKMDNLMKAYRRAHGSMPKPKTKVFLENNRTLKLFKKTVEKLMEEN